MRASNSVAVVPDLNVLPSAMIFQQKPIGGEGLMTIVGLLTAAYLNLMISLSSLLHFGHSNVRRQEGDVPLNQSGAYGLPKVIDRAQEM